VFKFDTSGAVLEASFYGSTQLPVLVGITTPPHIQVAE